MNYSTSIHDLDTGMYSSNQTDISMHIYEYAMQLPNDDKIGQYPLDSHVFSGFCIDTTFPKHYLWFLKPCKSSQIVVKLQSGLFIIKLWFRKAIINSIASCPKINKVWNDSVKIVLVTECFGVKPLISLQIEYIIMKKKNHKYLSLQGNRYTVASHFGIMTLFYMFVKMMNQMDDPLFYFSIF